jgi:hypothetical protein
MKGVGVPILNRDSPCHGLHDESRFQRSGLFLAAKLMFARPSGLAFFPRLVMSIREASSQCFGSSSVLAFEPERPTMLFRMNDDESILAELRRIGAWADMQRKVTKWTFIIAAVLVPGMIVVGIVAENRLETTMEDTRPADKTNNFTWSDVDWNIRRANLDEAIRVGEELIRKTPQYPEGHHRLATAYLAAGKTEHAREHYAQAFHLFPSEENEKFLMAIERRIKQENPQPNGAANGSQPPRSETNRTSSAAGPPR